MIPQPVKVVAHAGNFILPGNITIAANSEVHEIEEMINQFSETLKQSTGYSVSVSNSDKKNS